ncbi:hypothetical protein IAU60_005996 [Kwoniella sp. DSM 27419]
MNDYRLSAPSYRPLVGQDLPEGPNPRLSVYSESGISVNSDHSESSATGFRQYDSLRRTVEDNHSGEDVELDDLGPGQKDKQKLLTSPPFRTSPFADLEPEDDDAFHDPNIKSSKRLLIIFSPRGMANIGCLILVLLVCIFVFAGYPILDSHLRKQLPTYGAYNIGGINATGQIPNIGPFQLIDRDTPESAYIWTSLETGETWDLMFSDEFNTDGRTFWEGDDPYWEAVDLHYWQTGNLEWYDPTRVTTKGGSLEITIDKAPGHDLNYTGGMIQSWNRFCFTGGYVEASVSLPGKSNVYGLWPAIWTLGNLGRAGYGGSLEGLWPYSYDACDVGTLPNQTLRGEPALDPSKGDPDHGGSLSYLPGQRLSRCTCPDDLTHPGPKLANGTFVGRSAPEIDMFEAAVDATTLTGDVSQSAQWAPFNPGYASLESSDKEYEVYDDDLTHSNGYKGAVYQQATSAITKTNQSCYTQETGCFSIYGFEYRPGGDDGYITWVSNSKKAWTIRAAAMAPNTEAMISQRQISTEPMYLIINLGLSEGFGAIDYDGLQPLWPIRMLVDYIRVYQDPNARNIGCSPPDMPTRDYIERYKQAYTNPNYTTFDQVPGSVWPKNSLIDTC